MDFLLLAQEKAPEVVSGVPPDVFNYFAWAAGIIIAGLVAGIIVLWKSNKGGLTTEQMADLTWLKETHDSRDPDGILNWMVPRAWGDDIKAILAYVTKQGTIDEFRDLLDTEKTERREQVEALLREQKDVMVAALETQVKVGVALDSNNILLQKVQETLLMEQ